MRSLLATLLLLPSVTFAQRTAVTQPRVAATNRAAASNRTSASRVAVGAPLAASLRYVLITGQSLAAGGQGSPALSTTQPYLNQMHAGGVLAPNTPGSLVPLTESSVETIASGFANEVALLSRNAGLGTVNDVVVSDWAVGSTAYSGLKQGTMPYNNSVSAVANTHSILGRCIAPGVLVLHGESDGQSTTYQADIEAWQTNYDTALKAVTAQSQTVVMFHSQPSAFNVGSAGNATTAKSPYAIYEAFKAHPSKSVLVCAKYIFTYADGLHLTNSSYRWLGEYYGKAWFKQVVQGQQYSPLYPSTIARSGSTIDLTFSGVVGSLTLDTTAVSLRNAAYGFEYTDDSAPPAISAVAITGTNTVRVTLASTPTGANKRIRYAYTAPDSTSGGGPTTGSRGNLRDTDLTVSVDSQALYNWCVHFDEACP